MLSKIVRHSSEKGAGEGKEEGSSVMLGDRN